MTVTIFDDFCINFDSGFDRSITCHTNLDFALTEQGDIRLTKSAAEAVLQKIWLWMATKFGEVPGIPDLGCPIHSYFYKKATPGNFALLQREIQYSLQKWVPELQVQSVTCNGGKNDFGQIDTVNLTIISKDYGKFTLKSTKGDIEKLNEELAKTTEALDFIKMNNQ